VILPEEEARQRRVKQLEQQARDKKAAEAAAKEKDAQRQWILQYAEEESESDSNDDQKEQVSHTSFLHHLCAVSSPVCCSRHIVKCMPRADSISQVVWGRHCGMQAAEVIEDWELWGDPREVERRKADRARAAQPLHVRQAQVAPKKVCSTLVLMRFSRVTSTCKAKGMCNV